MLLSLDGCPLSGDVGPWQGAETVGIVGPGVTNGQAPAAIAGPGAYYRVIGTHMRHEDAPACR